MNLSEKEQRLIEAYRLGMTEQDPIVKDAIEVTAEALIALSNGSKYNRNSIGYPDYLPNGLKDCARSLLEPFTRVYAGAGMSQKRDVTGYASLFASWVDAGMPEGKFNGIVVSFMDEFYKNLKEKDANADRRANSKCA